MNEQRLDETLNDAWSAWARAPQWRSAWADTQTWRWS